MDSDIMHIGGRIRRLRRESKKTLLQVATDASLSVGFLSQVERNLTGISISSLVNVAKALNVPLGALLDQPRQDRPDSHQGSRESYAIRATEQRYERLSTSFSGSQLNAVKVQMMEGYCSEWVAHSGDEFAFILSGCVRYTVGRNEYQLGPGDSLHFDAHQRHRLANVGNGPAELIAVNTLQLFDDLRPEFPSLPPQPPAADVPPVAVKTSRAKQTRAAPPAGMTAASQRPAKKKTR